MSLAAASALQFRCAWSLRRGGAVRTIGGRLRCASASSKMANNGGLEEARNSVSRLCLAAKKIFASPKSIQGEDDLKDVIRALGAVTLEDVDLVAPSDMVAEGDGPIGNALRQNPLRNFAMGSQRDPVTYYHIAAFEHVSVGIFCIPANASIPLHDHPGMSVCSKVLFGEVNVKSYDWLDESERLGACLIGNSGSAKVVRDENLSAASGPTALFASSGGNIHRFTAVSSCAILDVLGPPYNPLEGRDCTYYQEKGKGKVGQVVQLAAINQPEGFEVQNRTYTGLPVQ